MTTEKKAERTPVAVNWSTDLKSIPKGKWINKTRATKAGKKSTVKVWERDEIWIVVGGNFNGRRQTIVIRTYWIPDEKRWRMMTPGQDGILAWAHAGPMTVEDAPPVLPMITKGSEQ